MSYAVFFDKNNETIRLPVNPEEIKIEKAQNIETYDVLKLGKISVPANTELRKYSFETELPGKLYKYVQTRNNFKPALFYLNKFNEWVESKEPVRLIINNSEGFDTSILVLIESLEVIEKSGEEGDYTVEFKLIEYKPFGKKEVKLQNAAANNVLQNLQTVDTAPPAREGEPEIPRTYVVESGDTLWGIAKRFLGDGSRYPELVKINPAIKNPALIYPGQVISLA